MENYKIPEHIAIIMDGNGRWAKKRFLTRSAGHKAGAQNLKTLCTDAENMGIKYMTVYAFSTENWKREDKEVNYLMNLLRDYIQQYINDSKKNNMSLKVIGRRDRIPEDLKEKIIYLEDLTKDKKGLKLIIALDYGGRDEIIRASKKIAQDVYNSKLKIQEIDEKIFESFLDTNSTPSPDLLIRTGGEIRISNFLLWELAYCELYFSDKYWPDFNKKDLQEAINDFNKKERRFGSRL